ncbi:hypothetical protein [Fusobacterium ulcerans]|uniref:hypothetical protein n=1 Tax=Fusobacterium ulcerans TaxID=861 RepID=UPI002E762FF5|nr:hypothetical protein [Fusobacterium ulcerans]MEE0137745.1 hypothetical protein [Fusobacterium ulcerans]
MKQRVCRVYPFIIPPAYPDYNLPPTLYRLLNSIVNFDADEQTKIKDLASEGRSEIFDFDYPLSTHVDQEDFEVMILNHFLMRRIGYDTLNAFKIALNVKLNEIMPMYNKMFDMLDGWDLFNDGERVTESGNNTLNNITSSNNISDRRYSDTPQQQLSNVQDGKYITDYNYDTDTGSTSASTMGTDSRIITRTPSDKIKIYKEFIENKKSIMTMIFEELDVLFYGLV